MLYVVETNNFWFIGENGTRVSSIRDAKKFVSHDDAQKVAAENQQWGCSVRLWRGI